MKEFEPVPAITREHVDPDALAKEIKSDLKAGIEHFREVGAKFLKCRLEVEKLGPGQWEKWLGRQRFSCSVRQIQRYMKLAKLTDSNDCDVTSSLESAWQIMQGNKDAEIDAEELPPGANPAPSNGVSTNDTSDATPELVLCKHCERAKRVGLTFPAHCKDCKELRQQAKASHGGSGVTSPPTPASAPPIETSPGSEAQPESLLAEQQAPPVLNPEKIGSKSTKTPEQAADDDYGPLQPGEMCPKCNRVFKPPKVGSFTSPTVEEVAAYCLERKNEVDPEQFHAHYQANGWKQANGNKIQNWKASVITWEKNDKAGAFQRNGHKKSETTAERVDRLRKEMANR